MSSSDQQLVADRLKKITADIAGAIAAGQRKVACSRACLAAPPRQQQHVLTDLLNFIFAGITRRTSGASRARRV
jgi:hypothetical protein